MSKMIVFPGQGSQFVGMGKELYENSSDARRIFEQADEALGFSITKLCFEGPKEELMLTKYTQPAILTVSYALWHELNMRKHIENILFMAGHSLGEYTALVASGVLDFQDAVKAVHKRGLFMQEAVEVGKGGMAAVINVPREKIYKICDESGHIVRPANFNSPKQVVISGIKEGVDYVVDRLKREKLRAMKLQVSAPFHSELMSPAQKRMENVLSTIRVNNFKHAIISNVTGRPVKTKEDVIDLLLKQITGAVKWEDSILFAHKEGVSEILEVGPGKVLTKLSTQIVKDIKTKTISSFDDILNFEA